MCMADGACKFQFQTTENDGDTGSRTIAPEKNCPPNPNFDLNPNPNPKPNRGQFSSGAIVRTQATPKYLSALTTIFQIQFK